MARVRVQPRVAATTAVVRVLLAVVSSAVLTPGTPGAACSRSIEYTEEPTRKKSTGSASSAVTAIRAR